MTTLEKKITTINEFITLDKIKGLEIISTHQKTELYWNKYEETCETSFVKIDVKYKESSLFIYLYHGIGYKSSEVKDIAIVTKESLPLEQDLYYENSPSEGKEGYSFEGSELDDIIQDILFEGDNPIVDDNAAFISDLAEELIAIQNVIFNTIVDIDTPNIDKIKEIGEKYLRLANGRLYAVYVSECGRVQKIKFNLTKEEAEKEFIGLANMWYKEDACIDYAEKNLDSKSIGEFTTSDFEGYYQSNSYYMHDDVAAVVMEVM